MMAMKYIEKELKQNLALKNVSVKKELLPFGLKILIQTRTPVASGEKFINGKIVILEKVNHIE